MNSTKKTAADEYARDRRFPAEAYEYNDDVTKEAVDKVREKAGDRVETGEWEVIDGFGRTRR